MIASTPSWADDISVRHHCRVCDSTDLAPYGDLGMQPLANAFLHREDVGLPEFTAPLRIQFCRQCGLSQLTHVVSPQRLYSRYLYSSGISVEWRAHCERLAAEYAVLARGEKHFVVDIASNDGTMLVPFLARGHEVLGIEPAENITQPIPVPTRTEFWSRALAIRLRAEYGHAQLITATNVFGHVDDVDDFLAGVRILLDPTGIAIIECPHILPLLMLTAFDTIYHEHLSYWSLGPLRQAAHLAGLDVYDVRPQHIHGGTMRYYLCHRDRKTPRASVRDLLNREHEERLMDFATYKEFQAGIERVSAALWETDLTGAAGYGASAKGNVLLNATHITLTGVYDDSPSKQGLFTPGQHFPVLKPTDLSGVPKLVLLSWNWAKGLKERAKAVGFRGEFLTPIPIPKWSRA